MTTANIQIGAGVTIGAGVKLNPPMVTAFGQNVTSAPEMSGFFFAFLNRNLPGWDYFADNGNNGTWTVAGNLGGGITSARVISLTHDTDSVFPTIDQGAFYPGSSYTFSGH
jgi:hypothetical protein